jgi:plasmid stabilization system protein ParE
MKPYELHPTADDELKEAAKYHEKQSPGLGQRVYDEFEALMERLGQFPESGRKITDRVRHASLKSFSYKVIYSNWSDRIYVIAFSHKRRDPDYWKDRI